MYIFGGRHMGVIFLKGSFDGDGGSGVSKKVCIVVVIMVVLNPLLHKRGQKY